MCCRNVKAVLEAGGSGLGRVVRVGVSISFRFSVSRFILDGGGCAFSCEGALSGDSMLWDLVFTMGLMRWVEG